MHSTRFSALLLTVAFASCEASTDRGGADTADAQAGAPSDAGAPCDAGQAGETAAGGEYATNSGATHADGGAGGAGGAPLDETALLCESDTALPPKNLACTGLYADIASKQLAPGVEPYAPAIPLWSDGAEKQRWISLPPKQKIDNSDPNEWVFPIGTKVWKQFSRAGHRVETRLWQKADTNYWVAATYAWNDDESAAERSAGGDIALGTGTYHIPTPDECQDCHRGRSDRLLGFEQTLLGLAGATGLNLDRLIAERRLTRPPAKTPLVIGDDGTGLAAPALAWLHVNCGTSCHNDNSSAKAWSTGLFMRLDPTKLDGSSVTSFDTLTTTIGVAAVTPTWKGQTRILPGDPAHSLLFKLISHRGTGQQMPPIASSVVDEADIPLVEAWIAEQVPLHAGTGGAGGSSASGGTGGGRNHGGSSSGGGANGGNDDGGGASGGSEPLGGNGMSGSVNGGTGGTAGADSSAGSAAGGAGAGI